MKTILVPEWAFDELMALRSLVMAAELPKDVMDYIREQQLKGKVFDPYARGTVIGIACLLARRMLNTPGAVFEPARPPASVLKHSQDRDRGDLIEIDGDVLDVKE